MTRLGIYGGTFSPIHLGHVKAAHAFLETMELDRLLVIPTAVPPHKTAAAGASASDRLTMTRLAFHDSEASRSGRLEISDYEIERAGKSYTIYTLEHFSAPFTTLFLLVGTDMFLTLERWYRAADIFRLADIVLMRRETDDAYDAAIQEKIRIYRNEYAARIHVIDERPLEVSSTELRERLQSGRPTDGMIPQSVADYIRENHLYQEKHS